MGLSKVPRYWRAVGLGAVAAVTLAGCNLGVAPVTYELVDVDQFNLPLGPIGVESGDVDGDGDLDVVATGQRGYMVLTNDGSGTYDRDFPDTFEPTTMFPSLVDVDGDDDLDLVGAITGSGSFTVFVPSVRRNDGTGAFGRPEPVPPDPPPGDLTALVTSDADGDGDVDLLGAFRVGLERHVGVYLNDGSGGFGRLATYSLPFSSDTATPINMVSGDLDGDDDEDVLATDVERVTTPDGEFVERTVAMVGLNNGNGRFRRVRGPIEVGSTGSIWALVPTLADVDGDGNVDLAVGGPGSVTTLRGDGRGGFGAPQASTIPNTREVDFLTSADIDDDGNVDLIGFDETLDATWGVVAYGDGAGGVDQSHKVITGTGLGSDGIAAQEVEITDLEGDGDTDILFLAGGGLGVVENATEGGRPAHIG
jgi:FG-GAP-like repeat